MNENERQEPLGEVAEAPARGHLQATAAEDTQQRAISRHCVARTDTNPQVLRVQHKTRNASEGFLGALLLSMGGSQHLFAKLNASSSQSASSSVMSAGQP